MQTRESLEAEYAAKLTKLERDTALASALPTAGVSVQWTGENGWNAEGKANPPIEKTLEIRPWIMHGTTAYDAAQHVAFKDDGEHVSSPFRAEFQRRYLAALLDACAPYMLQTVAVRGTYAAYFPETFDYAANRNYTDAREVARGAFEVTVDTFRGENGYSSCTLAFYIAKPEPCKISISIPQPWQLGARGNTDDHGDPRNWDFPSLADTGAVQLFKRAGATRNRYGVPTGYTLQWLFEDRESLETAISRSR